MKITTVCINGDWYIKNEGKFLRYQFSDGSFSWGDIDEGFNFTSEQNAADYIKNEIFPRYYPEIKDGKEYTFKAMTTNESCVFDLMRQMLQAEKEGNTELANKLNQQMLDIHEGADAKKKPIWKRLFKIT